MSGAPLELEPRLVEATVRLALERGVPGVAAAKLLRLRSRHRRDLDRIYAEAPGEAREAGFRDHYESLFGALGLERGLEESLDLFPELRRRLRGILVRSVVRPAREGAELWESRVERGRGVPAYLVISLAPARLADPRGTARFLLPRLQRGVDLLDPTFGTPPAGERSAPGAALGDAYERLWELSSRARLVAAGQLEDQDLTDEVSELAAAAGRDPAELFALLGDAEAISSRTLLGLAEELVGSAAGDESEAPSGRCPLCGFPTLVWAPTDVLVGVEEAIGADFPHWRRAERCCEHCADRYTALATAS